MPAYDNIEGTTTTLGSGSISRSGRIVSYSGAAVHLETGGVRGVDTSAGQIRTSSLGQLNVPMLQARMVEADTRTPEKAKGPLLDPDIVMKGLTTIGRAADEYVETMDNFRTKKADLDFRQKLFDLYHGKDNEGGYAQTKGFDATDGFRDFNSKVDSEMAKSLEGLSPSVRLKAAAHFLSTKEAYLEKASSHAAMEKEKIREGVTQAERDTIRKELHAFPPDAIGKNIVGEDGAQSYVASELKKKFFSTFDVNEYDKASKAWEGELATVGQRLYLDKKGYTDKKGVYHIGEGLEEVKLYRDLMEKSGELSADTLVHFDKMIDQWEGQETSNAVQNYNMRERQEEKMLKRVQNTTEAGMHMSLYSGEKVLSGEQVWSLVAQQRLSEQGARSYLEAAKKVVSGEDVKTDPRELNRINNLLLDTVDNNFLTPEGESVIAMISSSPVLKNETKMHLMNDAASLRKENIKGFRADAVKRIDSMIPSTRDMFGRKTDEAEYSEAEATQAYVRAFQDYREKLSPSEAHEKALESVEKRYLSPQARFDRLPVFPGVSKELPKPRTKEAVASLYETIVKKMESGAISKAEVNEATILAKRYLALIQEGGAVEINKSKRGK